MDGDWAEVKAKKVHKPKPQQAATEAAGYGGKGKGGVLVAGAVKQSNSKYGGAGAWSS